jgi:hypothetical protein
MGWSGFAGGIVEGEASWWERSNECYAHRQIMGLSAWASSEVTPVMHMSFCLMFLYSAVYENPAVDSPAKYEWSGVCSTQTIRQRINADVDNLARLRN